MYIVYCHTNRLNGKRYVGWTSVSLKWRWKKHCEAARGDCQHLFARALRKYGTSDDVWTHEVLETCETREDAQIRAEPHWIKFYESFGPMGYNMTAGGEGTVGYVKGPMSDEAKQHLSEINTKERHPMWGRHQSEEARRLISMNNPRRKAVQQLTLAGDVIATYSSVSDAARATKHPDSTKIGLCCRGIRQTTRGFRWRYA